MPERLTPDHLAEREARSMGREGKCVAGAVLDDGEGNEFVVALVVMEPLTHRDRTMHETRWAVHGERASASGVLATRWDR